MVSEKYFMLHLWAIIIDWYTETRQRVYLIALFYRKKRSLEIWILCRRVPGRNWSTQALRASRLIKEDGERRRGIIVIPLFPFYLTKWSTCNYFLRASFSFPGLARLSFPTDFTSLRPLSSFRLGRALRPPEARQFCRFKVVEVIKLLKRSLGFASFLESPPFSGYPSLFASPHSQLAAFFLHDYL